MTALRAPVTGHVRAHDMWIYAVFTIAIIAVTSLMLLITKIPVVVILSAATISSSALVLLVRLDLGYWDPFTHIMFVWNWFIAIAVSFLFVGTGRWLKRPFFLGKAPSESAGSARAL
ncbi:MAG: hypothetical protein AB7O31_00255 [Burkholderiales bacterium]